MFCALIIPHDAWAALAKIVQAAVIYKIYIRSHENYYLNKFNGCYTSCTMSEEDFTKLYRYFDERFAKINKQFERVNKDNDTTLNSVDAYAKGRNLYARNADARP